MQNENNITIINRFFKADNIRRQRQLNRLQNENNNIREHGYCRICNTIFHRASIATQLRSKKHLENQMIIPHNLFDENQPSTSRQNINRIYNPPRLSKLARNKIILDDKQLNRELAKKG